MSSPRYALGFAGAIFCAALPAVAAPPPSEPPASATTSTSAPRDPALSAFYSHLSAAALLDNREGTIEELEITLAAAQDDYVRGNVLGSAITLFQVLHEPRYAEMADLPVMESVSYHLGVALEAHGATLGAAEAYETVLARGSEGAWFRPALRRRVDLALASKDFARGLATLDAALLKANVRPEALAPEDKSERDYLEGRALQHSKRIPEALAAFERVQPRSRFYTAARYLSGVALANRRDFRGAESAFCEVVGGPRQQTAAFHVDHRYFPVRDLAQLGLGRVAHEERRHGHAFYHYFQIPDDSEHLASALFESSWTIAEEGEYAVARGLLADLETRFPSAPQTVEARLLSAMLALYDCEFREAEASFTAFIDEMAPVADHVDAIRGDPARVRALHHELVASRGRMHAQEGDLPAHRLLLSMIEEDPTYSRMIEHAAALRAEAGFAGALVGDLERTRARLHGEKTAVAREATTDPMTLLARSRELEIGVAGLERQVREATVAGADPAVLAASSAEVEGFRKRAADLGRRTAGLAHARGGRGLAQTSDLQGAIDADIVTLGDVRSAALGTAAAIDEQAALLAATRLTDLRMRIDDLMGEARMGRIDAVLGAKKKLEIEVQGMAAGRFPQELFGRLDIEGMVGDDEVYWPYEGEYWADEYEGYR